MSRKKEIVQGRMENYLQLHGYHDFTEYMNAVELDVTGKLERDLVNMLTTNHTFFMRESEHFDFLRQQVLPYLKAKESARRDLCVWCGAASSGEEPYALAMLLREFFALDNPPWDTKVLATDISMKALEQAKNGIYTSEQILPIPENWRRQYFRPIGNGDTYKVTEELKREVIFRKFNLMDTFPFKRKMHIVFLRNVMIYFDKETKKELLQKVYDVLEPGGYLFVGRTETIDRSEIPFQMVQPSIFRK